MQLLITLFFINLACALSPARAESQANDAKPGITLNADAAGHFTGNLLINNYSMPFMVDTGATVTTIPMSMAVAARLPLGKQVETSTANGRSFAKLTQVSSLKLGSAEIKNIEAHVNQHLDQVLIGMNTLKYFTLNQTADSMTLAINEQMLKDGKIDAGVMVGSSTSQDTSSERGTINSNPIKKSQVCDTNNHCITRYGN
jgi:aspartyl protease family protein